MDFSELLKISPSPSASASALAFSPNGRLVATVDRFRLFVRDAESLQIEAIFTCLDAVQRIEWSADSSMLLAAQYKRRVVQVWSVEQPSWTCKIDEGLAGLTFARWAPDGRHVLTTTDFGLRLTVWSLVHQSVSYIRFPKHADERGVAFSADGRYMAVAERRECRDMVGVYRTEDWALASHFAVDMQDLHHLAWSPDGRALCLWDTPLEYRVCVYSPDGRKLSQYEAYDHALGVKTLSWSPSGQFFAAGSYDQQARVFNTVTYKVLATLPHRATVNAAAAGVVVYREEEVAAEAGGEAAAQAAEAEAQAAASAAAAGGDSDAAFRAKLLAIQARGAAAARGTGGELQRDADGNALPTPTRYAIADLPHELAVVKPSVERANPRLGVGVAAWSHNDRYLATRNDNMPRAVWVWDVARMALACVLDQLAPVRAVRWDPTSERLAIGTDNGKLYLWTPQGASIVDVPAASFNVRGIHWNADGNSLALVDRARFCCVYLHPEEEEEESEDDEEDEDDEDEGGAASD